MCSNVDQKLSLLQVQRICDPILIKKNFQCCECGAELENEASCFEREGRIYCRDDYLRYQKHHQHYTHHETFIILIGTVAQHHHGPSSPPLPVAVS